MGCVLGVAGKPLGGRRWLTVWRAAVVYEERGERVMGGRECASPGRGRGGERERRGGGGGDEARGSLGGACGGWDWQLRRLLAQPPSLFSRRRHHAPSHTRSLSSVVTCRHTFPSSLLPRALSCQHWSRIYHLSSDGADAQNAVTVTSSADEMAGRAAREGGYTQSGSLPRPASSINQLLYMNRVTLRLASRTMPSPFPFSYTTPARCHFHPPFNVKRTGHGEVCASSKLQRYTYTVLLGTSYKSYTSTYIDLLAIPSPSASVHSFSPLPFTAN